MSVCRVAPVLIAATLLGCTSRISAPTTSPPVGTTVQTPALAAATATQITDAPAPSSSRTPFDLASATATQTKASHGPNLDSGEIVFEVDVGSGGIYLAGEYGRHMVQIVSQPTAETSSPQWIVGGARIAYLFSLGERDAYRFHLWNVDPDGGGQQELVTNQDAVYEFSVSPDGSTLAFTAGPSPDSRTLFALDLSSGAISQPAGSVWVKSAPAWSSDGRSIAFAFTEGTNDELFLGVAENGVDRRHRLDIPIERLSSSQAISWSPDSTKIAFAGNSMSRHGLFVVDVVAGVPDLLLGSDWFVDNPRWSPDGGYLVGFMSKREGDGVLQNLFRIDADGSNLTDLTHFPASSGPIFHTPPPIWSRDGRSIAFVSQQGDSNWPQEIFIVSAEGGGITQITNNPGRAIESFDWLEP